MAYSKHALARSSQRGIPLTLVDLILEFGESSHRPGNSVEMRLTPRARVKAERHLRKLLDQVRASGNTGALVSGDGEVPGIAQLNPNRAFVPRSPE